ncbi:saccharopine dehydrogenase / Homospermidine synthase family protein [Pseudohyphozyma bogoriensis]|nr:saccharopine dehydrogenase / Homospermidine synthase family protein [Pseudohyphozyma bogoriensis]
MSARRTYELVVYGATGFTGELVSTYLTQSYAGKVTWAAAGRSEDKVRKVLANIGATDIPVIVADASKPETLVSMVKQTKVVISLVGPYGKYGSELVKACAENGTHYVDLTGWEAKMIQQHGRAAVSTKALIVHGCGYDSIPSDLCTFLACQKLKQAGEHGDTVKVGAVKSAFQFKGGMSGGTVASLLLAVEADKEEKKISMNPYCLSPIRGKHNPSLFLAMSTSFLGKKTWGSFWFMGPTNSALVRRTWGVLENSDPSSKVLAYGPDFAYDELMVRGGMISSAITSLVIYFGFAILMLCPPARWALKKWGPQPGTGPAPADQKSGWFRTATTATSVDGKHQVRVTINGKGDPGYLATSRMIVESALAIVQDEDRLPPLARQGGFLTPATALGNVLVERLEATQQFSFTTEDNKSA